MAGSHKKAFNLDEVSEHNSSDDCWIIINAMVYNVTEFLDDHPGGDEVLLKAAGKDASQEFEEIGHGSAARLMLDEFYVGEFHSPTINSTTTTIAAAAPPPPGPGGNENKPEKGSNMFMMIIRFLRLILPLTVLGFAVGIYFYR